MRVFSFGLVTALAFLSCRTPSGNTVQALDAVVCDTLKIVHEIGKLMGDSLYVFGEITSAEPVSEGVAILDIHSCRISFFNHQGEFIRYVGGHGEGPGEFLLPIDFAVLSDGRIAVADLIGRKIDILSGDGEFIRTLTTGEQILPYRMDAVSDSTFFIYYYSTEPYGEEVSLGFEVELWNTSGFVGNVWSSRREYNGGDFSFSPGYTQCCAGNGSVFLSFMDNPEFCIERHSLSGIDPQFITGEAVALMSDSSDTGYDEPYAYVSFTINGVFVELESESLDFRPQIGALGMDREFRLWVRLGTTDEEKWLLYSSDGELCSTGTITGIPETGRLKYVINEYGAVAWAPYTEDYPVLYVLSSE